MPMLRIQSHNLAPGGEPRDAARRIDLSCAPPPGGRRAVASFELGAADASAVGYVTESAEGRLRVTGWFPRRQFRRLRDILARGGPLDLFFELRDRGARVGYLARIGLTGPEGVLATATATPALVRVPAQTRPAPPASRFAMPL